MGGCLCMMAFVVSRSYFNRSDKYFTNGLLPAIAFVSEAILIDLWCIERQNIIINNFIPIKYSIKILYADSFSPVHRTIHGINFLIFPSLARFSLFSIVEALYLSAHRSCNRSTGAMHFSRICKFSSIILKGAVSRNSGFNKCFVTSHGSIWNQSDIS